MKENRKEPLAPVPASTSSRSSLTPEREQRILLAAHYYHEKSKVKGNRCPYCGTEFTAMQDCIRKSCPQCGKAWTPEQKVRLNQDEVAELMRTPIYRPSRSEVQRLLSEAEEHGIVQILVTRAPENLLLKALEDDIRGVFDLHLVRIVPGREELFEAGSSRETERNIREAVLLSGAKVAAQEIVRLLDEKAKANPGPTLCISWGHACDRVVNQLRPTRFLPNLNVAPLVGALSPNPFGYSPEVGDLYDSNLLAQQAAEIFQCRKNAYWLLAPAYVRDESAKTAIQETILVKDTLSKIRDASIAVFSIAPPDPDRSTLVKSGLLTPKEVWDMVESGAIGDIAGHFFNKDGLAVPGIHPIGASIDDLKELVRKGRTIMAIVTGDPQRLPPLRVALEKKLISALVTDHITAQKLLR